MASVSSPKINLGDICSGADDVKNICYLKNTADNPPRSLMH